MSDILETIVAHTRQEVARRQQAVPAAELECRIMPRAARSMAAALQASPSGIIAEFKRRSPSKDWINRTADAAVVPPAYARAGAAALSILTDEHFFGGTLADIDAARPQVAIPILRKDFIVGEYQLLEARAAGADAALLIAACLSPAEFRRLRDFAHAIGLEVLLEVHGEAELDYIDADVDMVGVNNRNLGTFHTDVSNSFRLADRLPHGMTLVSESGLSSPATVRQLRAAGFRGFLMGEHFMKTPQPAQALEAFIAAL